MIRSSPRVLVTVYVFVEALIKAKGRIQISVRNDGSRAITVRLQHLRECVIAISQSI